MKTTESYLIQVFDGLIIEVKINDKRDGYTFVTPLGWGGRHYYSFCNILDDAFSEQYPQVYSEIYYK